MAPTWRRIGFGLTAAALAALLYAFSVPALLWMELVLVVLALALGLLLRADARQLQVELHTASGCRVGAPLHVTITAKGPGRYWSAGYAMVRVEIRNIMCGSREEKTFQLSLREGKETFETELPTNLCGELRFRCTGLQAYDMLGLFSARCRDFTEVRAVVSPDTMNLELLRSRDTVGMVSTEGLMQNRRGSDPSEIFDIREYVPGDDIRSIHWKLSAKSDSLITRQPSDPSHYDLVLMPDLGLRQQERETTKEEINSAASVLLSAGEGLLQQGVAFCLALPTKRGLQIHEVRSRRELHELLPQWLALELPASVGLGLQCFLTDRMEQYFTRLVIISAGKYAQNVSGLDKRIGITVLSTSQEVQAPVYTTLSAGCESVVLPTEPGKGQVYRIIC